MWLASRRLAHQPRPLARPAAVLGSLVVLLGALTGITTAIATQQQVPADDTAVVLLEWADPRPGDEQALTAALPPQPTLLPVASIDVGADTVTPGSSAPASTPPPSPGPHTTSPAST